MKYAGLVVFASSILSACGSSGGSDGVGSNVLKSGLVTLDIDGNLPNQGFGDSGISGSGSFLQTNNGILSGYRFAYGPVEGTNEYLGVAGFAPDSQPGDEITAGSISYAGTYNLAHVSETRQTLSGDINLMATFADGTVTGSADGITVNGVFSGTALGGSVSYRGINADLSGVVGQDRVIGAFAGNSSEAVLVGGIYAEATTP